MCRSLRSAPATKMLANTRPYSRFCAAIALLLFGCPQCVFCTQIAHKMQDARWNRRREEKLNLTNDTVHVYFPAVAIFSGIHLVWMGLVIVCFSVCVCARVCECECDRERENECAKWCAVRFNCILVIVDRSFLSSPVSHLQLYSRRFCFVFCSFFLSFCHRCRLCYTVTPLTQWHLASPFIIIV